MTKMAFTPPIQCLTLIVANVAERLGVTDYGARYDEEVLNHPEVLQELDRERRDLDVLETGGGTVDAALVETMRARAKQERIRLGVHAQTRGALRESLHRKELAARVTKREHLICDAVSKQTLDSGCARDRNCSDPRPT